MATKKKVVPRVQAHVERLREAGLDTQRFFDALVELRDDSGLPKKHREALHKLVAMESFIWYLEAIRNERIDRVKLREQMAQVLEEHQAAIRKDGPGEKAKNLSDRDIGAASSGPHKKGKKKGKKRRAGPRGQGPRTAGGPRRGPRKAGPRKKKR